MGKLLLAAIALMGALATAPVSAQTQPPGVSAGRILTNPPPYARLPNGAFACFADPASKLSLYSPLPNPAGHDLSGQVTWSPRMTNDACRATCASQNFVFAGTQSGAFCFCGNSAGTYGAASACTAPCSGSPGEMCGGTSANSVSLSGALGFAPKPVMPPPSNGGQCVINASGPGYRHFEVQTWVVNGKSMPAGANGPVYSMQWTVDGGGASQQVSTASNGTRSTTTILLRSWKISGGAAVSYVATQLPSGALLFHEYSAAGNGTVTEDPQRKYIDGVLQTPGQAQSGPWAEHSTSASIAMPNPTTITYSSTVPTAGGTVFAALAGTSGTVTCSWNVVR
jgi:hypothetical protein